MVRSLETATCLFSRGMIRSRDGRAFPSIGSLSLAKSIIHQRVAETHGVLGFWLRHVGQLVGIVQTVLLDGPWYL